MNMCTPQSDNILTTKLMCGVQSVSTVRLPLRHLFHSLAYGQINAVTEQFASRQAAHLSRESSASITVRTAAPRHMPCSRLRMHALAVVPAFERTVAGAT